MITQVLWTLLIWFSAVACYEGFRDETVMLRAVSFLGCVIAVGYGLHEANQLAFVWSRSPIPIDKTMGIEILLPIALCLWKVKPSGAPVYVTRR